MSSFIERLIADDFLWSAIVSHIPGRRRQSGTRFINFNCTMCGSRGYGADKRMRCGVKHSASGVGVSCFNCGFKTLWKPGDLLTKSMREFLRSLGVPEDDIKRLNHKAMSYRSLFEKSPEAMALLPDGFTPTFESSRLPEGAKSIDEWSNAACTDPDFIASVEYLFGRGVEIANATHFYWTPIPGRHGFNRRILIPYFHEGRTVGYTARAIDPDVSPRYHQEAQPNFLFNMRALSVPTRRFVPILEGVFDALAVDGVGTLGAHLNAQQCAWIKSYGRVPIVVPDRDKRGADLITVAEQNNWRVAFPALRGGAGDSWWDSDVKDAAEAVRRYGRLYTLLSIIESSTDNKLEINLKKRMFV